MKYRFLGKERLKVSAIGYGCPPFQGKLRETDEKQAIAVLHRAIELGMDFIDTADHNNGNNEEILAKALKGRRGDVVLTTKFGNLRGQPWAEGREVEGKPEYVAWACNNSLRRLETDYIDLYYLHRVDPKVPIEDTVGAMARLVEQGKVRHIGLSEAGGETLRRANAVHPVTAVQSEYSLWMRDYEANTIPVVRELGVGYVAYYALGRGFLGGAFKDFSDLGEREAKRRGPRFHEKNFQYNANLLKQLEAIADTKKCTVAQLALAWILHQGDFFVPIPGTYKIAHLESNAAAADIVLSSEELAAIDTIFPREGAVAGTRHDYDRSKELNI
ncbi:MAG TPA: aldo/keto reductase [Candidatus Limnocylindria bacterium]|nr:aldo/keto reductase [Candidatus Limnocylindria bacterium]